MEPESDSGAGRQVLNLSIPSESYLKAAVYVKDQVVEATWRKGKEGLVNPTMFNGLLGTAFTCFRSFQATGDSADLNYVMCIMSISGLLKAMMSSALCRFQVAQERALPAGPEEGGFGMSYELLYGRAGFLWAALFVNKHLGSDAVPNDLLMPIVEAVLAGGRAGAAANTAYPLMYRWHGTKYLGAANGLAVILQVLLHFSLTETDSEDVKWTFRHMVTNRFKDSGNYPSSEGSSRDGMVQWSHGATGVCLALCNAHQVFPSEKDFHNAAIEAGEVVWRNRPVKKVCLADGISGNAYCFIASSSILGKVICRIKKKLMD